jgi:hypothetical protein
MNGCLLCRRCGCYEVVTEISCIIYVKLLLQRFEGSSYKNFEFSKKKKIKYTKKHLIQDLEDVINVCNLYLHVEKIQPNTSGVDAGCVVIPVVLFVWQKWIRVFNK